MIKYLEIMRKVKNESKTNEKIKIFRDEYRKLNTESQSLFHSILEILFDVEVATHLGQKKLNKVVERKVKYKDNLRSILTFIREDSTGKDEDVSRCQQYVEQFEEEYRKDLYDIIAQKYTFGMKYQLINKALGFNLIAPVKPMLAYLNDKMNNKDKESSYIVTEKLDGNRFLVVCDKEGNKKAYSKNGKLYDSTYDDFLSKLRLPSNSLYDGELLPYERHNLKSGEQYKEISKVTRTKGYKDPLKMTYHIFDSVNLDEFESENFTTPYMKRRMFLETKLKPLNSRFQVVVPTVFKIHNFREQEEEILDTLNMFVARGKEGLMINKLDAVYSKSRTRGIFKLKGVNTCDIKCIDFEEGTGKNEGKLGAIVCEYKNGTVKVGSGFSDKDREIIWECREAFKNNIVEVAYTEESEDKDGNKSLRFPRVVRWRNDKTEKEVSYE